MPDTLLINTHGLKALHQDVMLPIIDGALMSKVSEIEDRMKNASTPEERVIAEAELENFIEYWKEFLN